jgi:hypothetical protein
LPARAAHAADASLRNSITAAFRGNEIRVFDHAAQKLRCELQRSCYIDI